MKTINVHNYEEFAIDYMVGNLSIQEAEAFTAFLAQHPDIADEVLLFNTDDTEIEQETFSSSSLKMNIGEQRINDDNFEEYCIAAMEGDLDAHAEARLEAFIGNDASRRKVKEDFLQTRLQDETIVYPHKEDLKKRVHKPLLSRRLLNITASIAAASVFAFGVFFILSEQASMDSQLAENSTHTSTIESVDAPPKVITQSTSEQEPVETATVVASTKTNDNKNLAQATESLEEQIPETDEALNNTKELLQKLRLKQAEVPANKVELGEIALAQPSYHIKVDLEPEYSNSSLREKTNKLLYTKVFAQGVNGLNKMAEANLGYEVEEDENGNPVRVIVKSRFGEFNRALAQR